MRAPRKATAEELRRHHARLRLPGWDGERCPEDGCLLNAGHASDHAGCPGGTRDLSWWGGERQGRLAL